MLTTLFLFLFTYSIVVATDEPGKVIDQNIQEEKEAQDPYQHYFR